MVLPMGGFSGTVPEPTLAAFQNLVRTGQVRFVLVGGGGFGFGGGRGRGGRVGRGGGGGGGGTGTVASITRWVESACTSVPAADDGAGDAGGGGALYRCEATGGGRIGPGVPVTGPAAAFG